LIIKLNITAHLIVFKYKYNNRKTQISYSIALSRGFSDETMTVVRREDSVMEDQILTEF